MNETSSTTIILPISEPTFWAISMLVGLVLSSSVVYLILPNSDGEYVGPIDRLCDHLGLSRSAGGLIFIGFLLFGVVIGIAAVSLFELIRLYFFDEKAEPEDIGIFAGLFGALFGGVFLGWRNLVIAKQARIQDDALFNERIKAISSDLSARRQISRVLFANTKNEVVVLEWEDDISTRLAAIESLENLVSERPDISGKVVRQLSTYVKARSIEFPPEEPPEIHNIFAQETWSRDLRAKCKDAEAAVQAIGKISARFTGYFARSNIDLRGANLQGFNLRGLDLSGAIFYGSRMEGADLSDTNLCDSKMSNSQLVGTIFHRADLTDALLDNCWIAFGDFKGAGLTNTILYYSRLPHAKFEGTKIQGAELAYTTFESAVFKFAIIDNTDFQYVSLRGAEFRATPMQNISLTEPQEADVQVL